MGSGNRLTEKEIERIKVLRAQGLPVELIAQRMGRSAAVIYKVTKQRP